MNEVQNELNKIKGLFKVPSLVSGEHGRLGKPQRYPSRKYLTASPRRTSQNTLRFGNSVYPYFSMNGNLEGAVTRGNKIIVNGYYNRQKKKYYHGIGKQQFAKLRRAVKYINKGNDSYRGGKSRIFKQSKGLYNKYLGVKFRNKRPDHKDPDMYILMGTTASGKTSSVGRYVENHISEQKKKMLVRLDADTFKAYLARRRKDTKHRKVHQMRTPVEGKPLAHAGYFHEESDELYKRGLKRALASHYDVMLDATGNNLRKVRKTIRLAKKRGYDVHVLGVEIRPTTAIVRASKRFVDGKEGRYVPLEIISNNANRINRNIILLRKPLTEKKGSILNAPDSMVIMDNQGKKPKIIYTRGSLNKNYRSPTGSHQGEEHYP